MKVQLHLRHKHVLGVHSHIDLVFDIYRLVVLAYTGKLNSTDGVAHWQDSDMLHYLTPHPMMSQIA